jgi:hypothetical protein
MKNYLSIIALLFLCGLIFWNSTESGPRRYNCTIAEWHPDYPREVRQACRDMRQEMEQQKTKKLIHI